MLVKWLSRSRQSMQRLGFSKAGVVYHGAARSRSEMAEVMRNALDRAVHQVPYNPGLKQWLERDRNIKGADNSTSGFAVSLQSYYVYDHPSATGWLSRLAFDEYFELLPDKLGLVTSSYDLTDYGAVLLHGLISEDEKAALKFPSACNPLVLPAHQQVFYLYKLLEADGDFLLPFCGSLVSRFGSTSFSYLEAGFEVPAVLAGMMGAFSGSVQTQADRQQFRSLETAKERIADEIDRSIERQGSGSRREQTTIPRLEWLTDLGLAQKQGSRRWRLSSVGLGLLDSLWTKYKDGLGRLYPENVIGAILDSEFYRIVAAAYLDSSPTTADPQNLINFTRPAYEVLSGPTGYCLLRPMLLLANCLAVGEQEATVMEYEPAAASLCDLYTSNPNLLRYTIDRFNTDYQIRFNAA